MMTDELDDVECVVMVLVDQFGRAAMRFVHDPVEAADMLPDIPSETWRRIAEAIERALVCGETRHARGRRECQTMP